MKEKVKIIISKIFGFNKRPKIRVVNFDKPYKKILISKLLAYWHYYAINIVDVIWWTLDIVFIGLAFARNDYRYLGLFFVVTLLAGVFRLIISLYFNKEYSRIKQEIVVSATIKMLETDPSFYSKKSTGEIISKINRGAGAFCDILANSRDVITSIVYITIAPISSLFILPYHIFLMMVVGMVIPAIIYSFLNLWLSKNFLEEADDSEDKTQEMVTETITQLSYIRSIFASKEVFQSLNSIAKTTINKKSISKNYQEFLMYSYYSISVCFYFAISFQVFALVSNGSIDSILASSVLLVYFGSNWRVRDILDGLSSIRDNYIQSNNLWKYIQNFGTQSFPVLEENSAKNIDVNDKTQLTKSLL